MRPIIESEKISLTQCRKIMNRRGKNYTDEELIKIRNWIYQQIEITLTILESKTESEIAEIKNELNLRTT